MSTEPLLTAFSNLDEEGQRSLLSSMSIPSLHAFYGYLADEPTSAHALSVTPKKVLKAVLKSMDIADCLRIVQLVAIKKQASALSLIEESKRMEVLSIMDDASRKVAIEKLRLRKRRRIEKWGSRCSTAPTIGKHSTNLAEVIMHNYEQVRLIIKEEGSSSRGPRGTVRRRLGVLDSPVVEDHEDHAMSA